MVCRRPTSAPQTALPRWRSRPTAGSCVGGNSGSDFALARYDANGGLDTSFSGDGKQTTDLGGTDSSNDVAIGRRRRDRRRGHPRGLQWPCGERRGGPLHLGRGAGRGVDDRLRLEPVHLRQRRRRRDPGRRAHRRGRLRRGANASSAATSRGIFSSPATRAAARSMVLSAMTSDFSATTAGWRPASTRTRWATAWRSRQRPDRGLREGGRRFRADPPQHRRHARRHLLRRRQADRRRRPRRRRRGRCRRRRAGRRQAAWSSGPRPAATSRSRAFSAMHRIPTRRVRTHRKRRSPAVRPGRPT